MKSVLLSYLDRNRVVHIPEGESDLPSLERAFRHEFSYQDVSTGTTIISFQIFDADWNDYVELDDDALIPDKSKIKVVITPLLNPQTSISSDMVSYNFVCVRVCVCVCVCVRVCVCAHVCSYG